MGFEGSGGESQFNTTSPGGHVFGISGWVWGAPVPKSITFFLDGSALVADQYGRVIRKAVAPDGSEVLFADRPPDASRDPHGREGQVVSRPQFATHAQVIAALDAEKINWLSYEVRWRDRSGRQQMRGELTPERAGELQLRLIKEGCTAVLMERTISCAGWPQLPYEVLKKLPELPPTPEAELLKIRDPQMRKDALRLRREVDAAMAKELQATE